MPPDDGPEDANRTNGSPGTASGQTWLFSSPANCVKARGAVPASSDTRSSTDHSDANTIEWSADHVAPKALGTSVSVVTAPPLSGTFFRRPLEKNPSHCPSGEKNGIVAPSVPATGAVSPVCIVLR